MKRIAIGSMAVLFSVTMAIIINIAILESPASAKCTTKYRTECVEHDEKGRCKKFQRVSYEECDEPRTPGGGVHVSPPKEECYHCIEYYNDGSCKKTKKVPCS